MMMSHRHSRLVLGFWLLCLIGLTSLYVVALHPKQKRLAQLNAVVSERSRRLEYLQKARTLSFQRELLGDLEGLDTYSRDALFTSEVLDGLDSRLHGLASENRLQNFASRNLFERADKHISELKHIGQRKIVADFSAGFLDFLRFLNALERHEPMLFVDQFQLTSPLDLESMPKVHLEFAALYEKRQETNGE